MSKLYIIIIIPISAKSLKCYANIDCPISLNLSIRSECGYFIKILFQNISKREKKKQYNNTPDTNKKETKF